MELGTWLLPLLAFLYAPTRLVAEANPEWRLVSWALALEVVGLTLCLLPFILGTWNLGSGIPPASTGERDGVRCRTEPGQPSSPLDRPALSAEQRAGLPISTSAQPSILNPQSSIRPPPSTLRFPPSLIFPLCFFLIAVPWPTPVEVRLIQWLTQANASLTVELLNFLGTAAIQHGNVIEVGTGVVGIDDACSGIRSFQATLMIALFFGELYRLSPRRRAGLCLAGFALSFLFNLIRTSLLTWVASRQGVGAIASWHDPAGVTILVACFLVLWLLSLRLREKRRTEIGGQTTEAGAGDQPTDHGARTAVQPITLSASIGEKCPSPRWGEGGRRTDEVQRTDYHSALRARCRSAIPRFSSCTLCLLAVWLLFTELGVEWWYRSHEARLPGAVQWSVRWPTNAPAFTDLSFAEPTSKLLRYDEGRNVTWEEPDGARWQGVFLRWNPGRIAVHLARNHTPEVCLNAAGQTLRPDSGQQVIDVNGLRLPFRHYVMEQRGGDVHVFYCLWEDRATEQGVTTATLTYANRLEPVIAGRRNTGQRSLELVVWGLPDPVLAEAALREQLRKLVIVPSR